MHLPVFFTELITVSLSQGRIVLKSIISTDIPASSAIFETKSKGHNLFWEIVCVQEPQKHTKQSVSKRIIVEILKIDDENANVFESTCCIILIC